MKLIVGLGNPGKEYFNTRHNIGFNFIDKYLKFKEIDDNWSFKFDGLYIKTKILSEDVIFLKPQTFMNLSGSSVKKYVDFFKIDINDILVISDDLDLIIGNFKLKSTGSCGGHNGLRDIENKLLTQKFKRLKIGISKSDDVSTKDYVLGNFTKKELEIYDSLFVDLYAVIDDFFVISFENLMSKYNRKNR